MGQAMVVVVTKRDAGDKPSDDDDCVIYRYGSFCTGIEVIGKHDLLSVLTCHSGNFIHS